MNAVITYSGNTRIKLLVIASILLCSFWVQAEVFELFPSNANSDCNEEFEVTANMLQPGDIMILHGGVYTQNCRRAISVQGTSEAPIVIRSAANETAILTRPADNIDTQNNIEIIDSRFVNFVGLEFTGGSIGVRFMGTSEDVLFENNTVHNTGNNAVALNSGNSTRMIFRGNEVFDTGNSSGSTEGEGFYVGCNNNTCRVTDSVFENNHIHDLRATSGGGNDGIELKVGSGGNTVRGNLIHHTTIGTAYPCVFAYGGGDQPNTIEQNVLHNCGQAIQVVRDAVIRNNVIYNAQIEGITLAPHAQAGNPANVRILNNTLFGHPTCLFLRLNNASNIEIANNALYCDNGTAINVQGIGNANMSSNYFAGALTGTNGSSGIVDGGASTDQFIDVGRFDFHLKAVSVLVDGGTNSVTDVPNVDLDGVLRPQGDGYDVGAYELPAANDNDGDGIISSIDNCLNVANPDQVDTDNDGFGNRCDPDLNNDLVVNFLDIALFQIVFLQADELADFSGDGTVNFLDYSILTQYFLAPPGPGATGN